MKKRLFSIFCIVVAIFNLCGTSLATDTGIMPQASDYLDGCSLRLRSTSGGRMAVDITVDAVGIADIVGVREIYIERQEGTKWKFYDSMDSVEHPEFYDYDSRDYLATIYFDGVPGDTYRVTITAYAKKGAGSDTLDFTSYAVLCR